MKRINLVFFITSLLTGLSSLAQEKIPDHNSAIIKIWKEGKIVPFILDSGTGKAGDDSYKNAFQEIQKYREKYFSENNKSVKGPKFILPVKHANNFNDPGFYAITAYVDHNEQYPDMLLDYNCGDLTYDTEDGYNHEGTDFFLWPFPWYKMYKNEVEIVAATGGILIYKQDGYFDQQCEITNEPWNGVVVLHEDGSTSWYIHMKKNSLTDKFVGEEIATGEYLGIVGSSGNSLSPHLHFEVYDANDELIDPFEGPCNETITQSWWLDQLPYKKSGINKISTNSALPVFSDCPQEEILNESDVFFPGDTIWLLSYFQNIFTDDEVLISVKNPDNEVVSNWSWTSPWPYYSASYLYFFIILENEQKGNWTYQMEYKGETYEHIFEFKDEQDIQDNADRINISVQPNPVKDFLSISINEADLPLTGIKIMNYTGSLIYKIDLPGEHITNMDIDFRNYESGMYFIKIESRFKSALYKVFKQ